MPLGSSAVLLTPLQLLGLRLFPLVPPAHSRCSTLTHRVNEKNYKTREVQQFEVSHMLLNAGTTSKSDEVEDFITRTSQLFTALLIWLYHHLTDCHIA